TVFEAGHVIQSLMNAALVDVELPDDEPVASVTSLDSARGKKPAFEPAPDPANDDLAASVKKVTAALADLFKPVTPPGTDTEQAPPPQEPKGKAKSSDQFKPAPSTGSTGSIADQERAAREEEAAQARDAAETKAREAQTTREAEEAAARQAEEAAEAAAR